MVMLTSEQLSISVYRLNSNWVLAIIMSDFTITVKSDSTLVLINH